MNKRLSLLKIPVLIVVTLIVGFIFVSLLEGFDKASSSDSSCISCHVHPHADNSWKVSSHHNNKSGVVVHCVDCHLPPKGHRDYWPEKMKAASLDLYSYWFRDIDLINWEKKSTLESAVDHTFEISCIHCHENLFPLHLSKKGDEAHLYYKNNKEDLHCINCHLGVGHGVKKSHTGNINFLKLSSLEIVYDKANTITEFSNFEEQIPGTSVSFEMIAIPGGKLKEAGNARGYKELNISPFFMGKIEVSWAEYRAFLRETESEGRMNGNESSGNQAVDAISGATPPWGDPSQGWGMGKRPAITMTWKASQTYCRWLSQKTGKNYRLPTEAEWEYACRAGSEGEFFFGGKPSDYEQKGFLGKIFGTSSDTINDYVIWNGNSEGKTQLPERVKPNLFGLLNMLGNVKEFCSDWHAGEAWTEVKNGEFNPQGPATGKEHVVRGGSFRSGVEDVQIGSRDFTRHEEWLKTDPQIPKSIWWYSDCNDVGFRVVCEWQE